jgi:hypothetical protein
VVPVADRGFEPNAVPQILRHAAPPPSTLRFSIRHLATST